VPSVTAARSRLVALARRPSTLAVVLGLLVALAYLNSLSAPFLFDDYSSIVANPSIRQLDRATFDPPSASGETVGGRPILNLSLALNYAAGRLDVRGYHLANLAIHLASALVLFGLIRRTLDLVARPSRPLAAGLPQCGPRSAWPPNEAARAAIAFATAALWALHPLQTESVTYIVQRAESLVGFFYLLTLYAVCRSGWCHLTDDRRAATRWAVLAATACALGMGTKEVMVTAPLVALLYDRTFIAGSFASALRAQGRMHAALAVTWVILIAAEVGAGSRGHTAGWSAAGVPLSRYLLTQADALCLYLRLAVWPSKLVFDYGAGLIARATDVVIPLTAVGLLLIATVITWRRRPVLGFAGACFFLILAPSSSIVPVVSQTIAEHRMYLPLALVLVAAVSTTFGFIGRMAWPPVALAALAVGTLTVHRNTLYQDPLRLWSDVAMHRPDNARARSNLAVELLGRGWSERALVEGLAAVRLDPNSAEARNNLATALSAAGRKDEAIAQLREALRLNPDYPAALNNLGRELMAKKASLPEAIANFEHALRLLPNFGNAETNLSLALAQSGHGAAAVAHARRATALEPNSYQAFNNLGIALASSGQAAESLGAFAHAARLSPTSPTIHENWAKALVLLGRTEDAAVQRNLADALRARH
jgi:protein O-mannosyl-transferase